MRFFLICSIALLAGDSMGGQNSNETIGYLWGKGDQWGTVLLSLGNERIWGEKGSLKFIEQRDLRAKTGQLVKIPVHLIKWPCNVRYVQGRVEVIRKIKNLAVLNESKKNCPGRVD